MFEMYNNLNMKSVNNKNSSAFNKAFSKFLIEFFEYNPMKPYNPVELVTCIRKQMPNFQRGEMQDAHEFLFSLLDKFARTVRNSDIFFTEEEPKIKKGGEKVGFINSLFSGSLKQIIKCTKCDYINEINEDFNFLGLGIPKYDYIIYVAIFENRGNKYKYKIKINKLNKMIDLLNILN